MASSPTISAAPNERDASQKSSRLRSLLLSVLVLVVSCLVALILAEICVRLIAPQQVILKRRDIWKPAAHLGWNHWPNVQTTINTGERTVPYRTDQDGFRVAARGRVEASRRILLLGDSFVEALQVPYESSLPGLLEARLPEKLGTPIAVRNAGVGGWSPSQYLLQARESLRRDHFDLVVVAVFLGNDVELQRHDDYPPRAPTTEHHLRMPRHLSLAEFIDAVLFPINDALETRSQLFILAKNATTQIRTRLHLSYLELPEELLKREADSPRWNVTADVLRDIAKTADSVHTPTLFVLLPAAYQIEPRELQQYVAGFGLKKDDIDPDQSNRILSAALKERRLDVVDVTPSLHAAHQASSDPLYGAVDVHFTPRGHDVATEAILPRIVSILSSRPGGSQPTPGPVPKSDKTPRSKAAR